MMSKTILRSSDFRFSITRQTKRDNGKIRRYFSGLVPTGDLPSLTVQRREERG